MLTLDHIAVAAETLEEAKAHIEASLDVSMQSGGQHLYYSTHNCLLGLDDGLYLEAIAIDPALPKPEYPRWFDLDSFQGPPRIGNWICRTQNIRSILASLPQAGAPIELARGSVQWTMAVPSSGKLPYDNCFPALMQWKSSPTPSETLSPSGCRLSNLRIRHPDARSLAAALYDHLRDDRVKFEIGSPCIQAEFETPKGRKVLQ